MKNASIAKCSVISTLIAVAAGCSSASESVGSSGQSAALVGGGASLAGTGTTQIMSPSDPSLSCSDDLPIIQTTTQMLNGSCGPQTEWQIYADGIEVVGVTCDAAAKDDPMPDASNPQALGQWWAGHACSVQSFDVPDAPDPCADAGYVGSDATGILINRCVDATPGCGDIYDAGREWGWVSSPSWYGQQQNDGSFIDNAPDTFTADCNDDLSCCDYYDVPVGMTPDEIHACDRFFISSGGSTFVQVSANATALATAPSQASGAVGLQPVVAFKADPPTTPTTPTPPPTTGGSTTSNGEALGHGSVGLGYALIAAGALLGSPQMSESGQKLIDVGSKIVKVYEERREQRRRLEQERLPGQPAVVGPPDPTEAQVRRYFELAMSRKARADEIADARRALEGGNPRIPPEGTRPRPGDVDPRIPGSDPRRLPGIPRPRPRGPGR